MTKNAWKWTAGIGAAVVLGGVIGEMRHNAPAPAIPSPIPADICTGSYYYQRACDTTWLYAWPGSGQPAGHTYQGCDAHDWIVHAEDGKDYPIRCQWPATCTFKRPPDAAPSAQAAWDGCYLPPHTGLPASYHCADAIKPPGVLNYAMRTLAQVPEPPRHSFVALFRCGVPVTPGVTPPPIVTPGPCPPCPPCGTPAPGVTAPPAPNPTRTRPPRYAQRLIDKAMEKAFQAFLGKLAASGIRVDVDVARAAHYAGQQAGLQRAFELISPPTTQYSAEQVPARPFRGVAFVGVE